MLLLNDNELLEGIIGAFGFLLIQMILSKINLNKHLEMFFAWMFVWYLRKIANNIYNQQFKNKGSRLSKISLF